MKTQAKPYHHGDLKNALIKAGLEILTSEGYAALSLRKVARNAGVSHTAPYNHFANKEALIGGIAAEGFSRLTCSMESAMALYPDNPYRQLSEIGWGYVRFALENPDHLHVMFSNSGGAALIRQIDHELGDPFEILLQTIEACQASGDVVEGDPLQLAFAAWAMVHGTAVLLINTPFPPGVEHGVTQEQMARANIQIVIAGLGSHSSSGSASQ